MGLQCDFRITLWVDTRISIKVLKNHNKQEVSEKMADRCAVWYPTIFPDRCDGCQKLETPRCIQFCPNKVFEIHDGKVVVTHPYTCVYGCTACQPVCPRKAISFPQRRGNIAESRQEKGLLRKVMCKGCGKTFWTNRDIDLCFDCEK